MPEGSIFDPDPLETDALLTQLGGSVPLSPVPALDERIKRARLEQLTAEAAKRQEAMAKEFVGPIEPTKPDLSNVRVPNPMMVGPQEPPPMSVKLPQQLGQVPSQPPPGAPARPTIDDVPEVQEPQRPPRIGAMDVLTTPLEMPAAGLAGAYGAMLDQPAEAGVGDRLSAAMSGAGGAMHDRLMGGEQPTMKSEALERGVDTGMTGSVSSFMVDPLNATGPLDLAQIVAHLPALAKGGVAMAHALPIMGTMAKEAFTEGPVATAKAVGAAYDGYKALKQVDPAVAKAFTEATKNYPRVRKAAASLHPSEVARLTTVDAVREFDRFYEILPDPKTLLGGVHGGAAKRGWYENSRKAIEAVYGEDADLFAGVLASTSPRIPVQENFKLANQIFDAWKKAGRPDNTDVIKQVMQGSMNRKVLPAWVNNTVSTLQEGKTLSGAKVDSFWTNLRSRVRSTPYGEINPDQATTLDAWMANLFGVHKETFGGSPTAKQLAEGNPGLSPQYLAGSARVREAAKAAGLSPAEAQETIWSWGKALYEQAEDTGMSARQIIQQGLLDQKRLTDVPDFATLFQQMGHKIDTPMAAKWTPDAANKKEMLVLADTLDELRAQRGRATAFKTAAPPEGTAMASFPLEARSSPRTGIHPDFPATGTQNSQDAYSSARLSKLEDAAGRNILAEALYPGRTAPVAGGRGDWTTAENVLERNRLQTTPVQMRVVEGENGPMVHPEDTTRAGFLQDALAYMLGQEGSAMTTMHPVPEGGAPNVVRAWQRKTGEYYPQAALDDLRKFLPADQFALEQGTEGITIKKFTGEPLTPQEQAQIEQVAKDAVVNMKTRTPKQLAEPEKLAGSRAMVDISDPSVAYRDQPWASAPVGGRVMTERLLTNWDSFPSSVRRDADKGAQRIAEDLLRVGKGVGRPDQIEALKILQEGGFSGLAKALGDPNQLLPVLMGLGLAGALGITASQQQDEKGGGT